MIIIFKGSPSSLQGGGGGNRIFCRGQIIYLTRLGDALKISHFITCLLHRKHIDVNYIFHADSAPKLFILEIEWWSPYALVKTVQLTLLHIRSEVTGLYNPHPYLLTFVFVKHE